jgi:hypothetical protein
MYPFSDEMSAEKLIDVEVHYPVFKQQPASQGPVVLVRESNFKYNTPVRGALAQLARAPHLQCGGHRFEPDMLHHDK